MPVAYDPHDFWHVLCSFRTLLKVIPRSLLLLTFAVLAACLEEWQPDSWADYYDPEHLTSPFVTLVGLLTSFRVNDAYNKWGRAADVQSTSCMR